MKICIVLNKDNVIEKYGICLSNEHIVFDNGILLDTELNLEKLKLVNNYKYVDGEIIELTEEEKVILFPTQQIPKTEIEILKETVDALVLANLGGVDYV